jgi:hypothetical protein
MGDGHERRTKPRLRLKTSISVFNEESLLICELFDVNVEGICFYSDEAIGEGSTVSVMFPGDADLDENELEAQILRCGPMTDMRCKIVALLTDPNPTYLGNISKLISSQK